MVWWHSVFLLWHCMVLLKTNFSLNNLRFFFYLKLFFLRGRFFLLWRVREVQLTCFRYQGWGAVSRSEEKRKRWNPLRVNCTWSTVLLKTLCEWYPWERDLRKWNNETTGMLKWFCFSFVMIKTFLATSIVLNHIGARGKRKNQ